MIILNLFSLIVKKALLLYKHSRFHSWNQPVHSNQCKVSCSMKQRLVPYRAWTHAASDPWITSPDTWTTWPHHHFQTQLKWKKTKPNLYFCKLLTLFQCKLYKIKCTFLFKQCMNTLYICLYLKITFYHKQLCRKILIYMYTKNGGRKEKYNNIITLIFIRKSFQMVKDKIKL